MIDERMLRIYAFMVRLGRKRLEEVPEPYRTALIEQEAQK